MTRPQPGAALGASYRLVEQLGSGAAGDVWRAVSNADEQSFAAKILKAEHTSDPALVERFIRERSVLMSLRHPNIVTVRDLVVEGATLAIVMDHVRGGSVRELLDQRGPLPAGEAMQLCAQVFAALSAAHGQQVTHRDIKPDNILLAETWRPGQTGTVRVSDFGIASVLRQRSGQTTGLLGTPEYMAPELISQGETSPAADIYSTGVMLYELLAGRTPFAGPGTDFTVAYRHVTAEPPRLELPDEIWGVIARLLAKNPRERPQATAAAAELRQLAVTFRDLAPLPQRDGDDFDAATHQATVLRSDLLRPADHDSSPRYTTPHTPDAPELGESGQRTLLRPLPNRPTNTSAPASSAKEAPNRPWARLPRKHLLLLGAGLALIAGLGAGAAWILSAPPAAESASADTSLSVSQQDQPRPTGLIASRTASYDPATQRVDLEITYAAQKAPLGGTFLEVVPAIDSEGTCPPVVWEGARASKHQRSSTGIAVDCGWRLDAIDIPTEGQTTITASFPATIADTAELDDWLETATTTTTTTLSDRATVSTAYPVQRLQDISVVTPSRTVSETPLPVTLVPVWPSGPDELNPIYRSPSVGAPSQMLQSIAGGETGVRFSDSCAGAVAVSTDGLVLTTLWVSTGCSVYASVGNFTSLQSPAFSITTRE